MGKVIIIESKREEGQGQAAQVCSKGSNLLFTFVLFLAFALLFSSIGSMFSFACKIPDDGQCWERHKIQAYLFYEIMPTRR